MNRRQILQNIFGYLSEEESASSHEMNHQPEFNSDEKDRGTERASDAISSHQVEIDSKLQLNEDTVSTRSSDEGFEHERKIITGHVIKIESGAEIHHEARSTWYCDGGAMFENEITFIEKVKIEGGAKLNDEAAGLDNETRCSRLIQSENNKLQARISDVIRAVFGDSDVDAPAQYGVEDGTDQGKNNSISLEHKVNYEKDLESEGIASCEHTQYVPEEEKAQGKLEEESICRMLVLEIPQRNPLTDPSQMATTELPNLIGFDNKPFDPTKYVEEEFYITDSSGSERLIPPTNMIQWRNVINLDGSTSVESNARVVHWSDGSLQLLIGSKAFDITEEDANVILSHALLWNKGIYHSLGRISKSVKVASSSVVSDSNSLTALVDWNTTPLPETVAEQLGQGDPQTIEGKLSLNQKNNGKKVTSIDNLEEDEGPKNPQ